LSDPTPQSLDSGRESPGPAAESPGPAPESPGPAAESPGPTGRNPWWRLTLRDVFILVLLVSLTVYLHWPNPPAGPVRLLQRGTVGATDWSVLAQRAGSLHCLQVRAGGARRALMCDQHWERDIHRLWHGPLPPSPGSTIGPPSLLRVRFPGTDQVLVVSVLYDEIATLTAPPRPGADPVVLHTTPLVNTDFHYVVALLASTDAANLRAFAADGEPLFYYFAGPPRSS
jgi:hypothetical protein